MLRQFLLDISLDPNFFFLFVHFSPRTKMCTFLTFNTKTKNYKMYFGQISLSSPFAGTEYSREQHTVTALCVCARAEMATKHTVTSAISVTILSLCGLRIVQIMCNTLFHTIHRAELLTITKANR